MKKVRFKIRVFGEVSSILTMQA